jgi:RNA polymerase sigma-70 factor (ECF subfamily)
MRDSVAAPNPGTGVPDHAPPEADLLARARAGEQDALEELCRENWLPVYRAVCRAAGTPGEAEDLTQEVFVRAIAALGSLRETDIPYRAYLLRVARNLAIDHWRAHQRRDRLAGPGLADQADPAPGPEAIAISRDERDRLLEALDRLPDDYSDVLRLRLVCGHTAAEAGALRGQSANAIRQLQFRAMAALRLELAAGTPGDQWNGGER